MNKTKQDVWTYEGDGRWTASSEYHDDGVHFEYVITVIENGSFSVNDSDSELIGDGVPSFATLEDAKSWCVHNDQTRS